MGCGASSARKGRAPHRIEESFHPPTAAAERAALRSAQSFARAHGSSGSAGCGAERLQQEEKELRTAWRRASIPQRRQQSMPHYGVRVALLGSSAAPAVPYSVRSVFGKRTKSSAPHGAELPSPTGGSRACRTPECAKLCSRPRQHRHQSGALTLNELCCYVKYGGEEDQLHSGECE